MTNTLPIKRADDHEVAKVRTITFRTRHNANGTVTGIPLDPSTFQVRMFSAGCLHGIYEVPKGSTILTVERR